MGINLHNKWHLKIVKAIHNWENRFVIKDAISGNGDYPPTVGLEVTADGPSWILQGEYRQSDSDPWAPTDMMIDPGVERFDIKAIIGSEDPLPHRDFEDIQWEAQYLGDSMFEIPYRPYAIRKSDLFQMPDGIFEATLGEYFMGVCVTNRWGLPFTDRNIIDISPESRADLASKGININDAWTQSELSTLGQRQSGSGMIIGPLEPGKSKIIYFKINVSNATPRKHQVEFVCWNTNGMIDKNHPRRRVKKSIFVSKTIIDTTTGEIVSEVHQGTMRVRLNEVAIDRKNAKKGRRRKSKDRLHRDDIVRKKLREAIKAILEGKNIDPCIIQRILACYCSGGPVDGKHDPQKPGDGRFTYDPFYAIPTKFSYTIIPREPFEGQYGPVPFDDPWWKVVLLIVAVIFLLAGMFAEAADIAYQDEDLVIGTLGSWHRDDIDAALCELDTDRGLSYLQVLDAQSDEAFQDHIVSLDGNISLVRPIMSHAEIENILTSPLDDPQRKVFKSGARTGLTHGIIVGLVPSGHGLATWGIDQLIINQDPDFGEPVSRGGDSGSIWVHSETLRPIALHHSGDDDDTRGMASLLEDVERIMEIHI